MPNELNLESALAPYWQKHGLILTSRQYRQLAKSGAVPAPQAAMVDTLLALVKIAVYYQQMAKRYGSATLVEARTRKEAANAEIREIELAKMKGEVRDTRIVIADLAVLLANFKTHVRAWSKSLSPLLFGRDERKISTTILDETDRLLTDLSQGIGVISKKRDAASVKKKAGRPRKEEKKKARGAGKPEKGMTKA